MYLQDNANQYFLIINVVSCKYSNTTNSAFNIVKVLTKMTLNNNVAYCKPSQYLSKKKYNCLL